MKSPLPKEKPYVSYRNLYASLMGREIWFDAIDTLVHDGPSYQSARHRSTTLIKYGKTAMGNYVPLTDSLTVVLPKGYAIRYFLGAAKNTAIIHEMAHYYDINGGMPSSADAFRNLIDDNVREYVEETYYFGEGRQEDDIYYKEAFAVMMACYILDSDGLSANFPNVYSYFEGLII